MQGKVSFLQRSIKDTTNTMVRGKILEAVIEDENPYQADLFNAACACGSGGGCSGGNYRAMLKHRTF